MRRLYDRMDRMHRRYAWLSEKVRRERVLYDWLLGFYCTGKVMR